MCISGLLIFLLTILIPAWASSSPAFPMMYSAYKLSRMTTYSLDVLLSQFWISSYYSMSHSNCCFLTCIQISQEAGKVVWYSHLFKNFPQFVVIHTDKSFSIVNEAEVDVFSRILLLFSMIQWMLAIWSLVPLPFLNPAWTSGSSRFTYCWSLAWRILSISLLACEMSAIVWWFEQSLALPFFGIGMKADLFQSCGPCWVFQICWHIECSTLNSIIF